MSIDRTADTWIAVSQWATDEIAKAHMALEEASLDHIATESLRGGIAKLRALLALPDTPSKPVIPDSPNY